MPAKKLPEKKPKKPAKPETEAKETASVDELPEPKADTPAPPPSVPEVKLVLNQPDTVPATSPPAVSSAPPVEPVPLDGASPTAMEPTDDFEPEGGGGVWRIILIFVTALLVGGGAVAGFLYYSKSSTPEPVAQAPSPTPATAETEEPIATGSGEQTEEVDASSLSVQILNGSGTAGEAARVRDLLETAGFTKFSLGNADSYDYTDTEVQVKEGLSKDVFTAVADALTGYTSVEKDALSGTNAYDIVIVVGKKS